MAHRILVVDDDPHIRDVISFALEKAGMTIETARDGGEALTSFRRQPPDMIILDIGMPDITGFEVARRVRLEPWGRDVYLIAVTGWGQKEDKALAIASGFDHHLTKPVDPDEVEIVLQTFFRRQLGPDVPAS